MEVEYVFSKTRNMLNVLQELLISEEKYKFLLMCRVDPKKIRQPNDNFWVLNPTQDEIKPYRILIKKYFYSPLSDNKLKIDIVPIDYIVRAINSNDFSFYGCKSEERFTIEIKNKSISKNTKTGEYYDNEFFILRLYTTMYFIPIYIYV